MKFHVRLGSATLAGVFALSAIGAAQAENEDPSELPNTELLPVTSDGPSTGTSPEDEPSDLSQPTAVDTTDGTTESPLPPPPSLEPVNCAVAEVDETEVLVDIPAADGEDFVEIDGIGKHPVDDSSQAALPHEGQETLDLTIWKGEAAPVATCSVSFSLDGGEDEDVTEEPSGESTDGTQPPDDSDTGTPDAPPEPTTPAPEPPESTTSPPPGNTDSAVPPQQPPPPRPSTSQAPVEPAPPTQNNNRGNDDPAPAAPVPQPPSQESTSPVEREIRQHSDNPRHLLSRIWDTDSHNGSGLIMPRPRDHTAEATELETLPPVSEDELDAIKARVSTPDKGNGLASDDLLRADVNERLTHSDTWWFVSSIVGLGVLGAGVWWAVARRKPRH